MRHPQGQYGLTLIRINSYIDLSNPIALFESKRGFILHRWDEKQNLYMPWIRFSGSSFSKILNPLLSKKSNQEPMKQMNKFFDTFEDLQEWLGDYFVLFIDDLIDLQT